MDEQAVLDGIAAGKIRKYVSDFPNPTTAGQDGVIVIPHLGASTAEAEDNCAIMAVQEISDYMENGNITHSVNYRIARWAFARRQDVSHFALQSSGRDRTVHDHSWRCQY